MGDRLKEFFAPIGHFVFMWLLIAATAVCLMIAMKFFKWYQSLSFGIFELIVFPLVVLSFIVIVHMPMMGVAFLSLLWEKLKK
jgi:membrane protein required for beta-lactamase induction